MQYKSQTILEVAKNLNKKPIVILDLGTDFEANKKAMNMNDNIVKPGFIDWLAYFKHASYVITDSFHGACFSIMFGKKFVAIKNREKERFDSLAKLIEYPSVFVEDSMLLGKTNIFVDIDYSSVHKHIELKRIQSEKWLSSALNIDISTKNGNDSVELMLQLYQSLHEQTDFLNKMYKNYAYEEEHKNEAITYLREGKTWLEVILARNHIVSNNSKLENINNLQEYFSTIRSMPNYVIVLSCADECSKYWKKFLHATGLQLCMDVGWRQSYVSVVDGGVIKVDQKSKDEINVNYEFVIGHPKYSVEYINGELKVGCAPLQYCRLKVKSKGFTGAMGAFKSEIMIDNIDYSMNKTGINIVVIDKETGYIMDSINVNTYGDSNLKINRR